MKTSIELDDQEPIYIKHAQKETLDRLKAGEIETVVPSFRYPIDDIVGFGLKGGFLQTGLKSFPDPRKDWEVPIEVMLLAQVLQRLNNEHSLLLAPYMLNSAELITTLGYNVRVLEEGFNEKNIYPREAAYNGETLKHILNHLTAEEIISWYNREWLPIWRKEAPGRTRQYIVDGTKIKVPLHLVDQYQGAGIVRNNEGELEAGYKVVWLQEIIDKKGILVSLKVAPISVHDLVLGKELVKEFPFEENSSLIMDRGFIDASWITQLKEDRRVDVCIPLRSNMDVTVAAKAMADNQRLWKPHPKRAGQSIASITGDDLFWKECPSIKSSVLVRWVKRDGTPEVVLFVTTKENISPEKILAIYDQRAEIEESHRELKCFQGLEIQPSKKFTHVVFRVVTALIGFNLLRLFLHSVNCETLTEYTLKTLRQKRPLEENPKIIIYTKTTFAVLKQFEFLPFLLGLKKSVQKKLAILFKQLNLKPAPS